MSLPEDTSTIRTLTVMEAATLVGRENGLYLPKLSSLTPDVAEVLVKHEGPFLDLDGLTAICPAVAKSLATFEGELSLTGLAEISPEVGALLSAKPGGRIYLPKNFRGSAAGARAIVRTKGKWIAQETIDHLEPALAAVLARSEGSLVLPSLTTISTELAESLASRAGEVLCLDGLTALSSDIAELLTARPGHLSFDGVKTLPPNVAAVLGRRRGRCLFLSVEDDWLRHRLDNACEDPEGFLERGLGRNGIIGRPRYESVRYLTEEIASALSQYLIRDHGDSFYISEMIVAPPLDTVVIKCLDAVADRCPQSFTKAVAYVFVQCDYDLYLNGLIELSDDDASDLAKHRGDLHLSGLRSLTSLPLAAKLASGHHSQLHLNGLRQLSPEVAAVLAEYDGGTLHLNGLHELSMCSAQSLARFKASSLSLCGLTEISSEAAAALGQYLGRCLYLDRLRVLTSHSAAGLAQYRGDRLFLRGLLELSPDAAAALAEYSGSQLYLDGLHEITSDTAKALARFKGDCLLLRGIADLSPELLEAFEAFSGKPIYTRDYTYPRED
jgi:hypothetical protein